jgi:hypothetical protein
LHAGTKPQNRIIAPRHSFGRLDDSKVPQITCFAYFGIPPKNLRMRRGGHRKILKIVRNIPQSEVALLHLARQRLRAGAIFAAGGNRFAAGQFFANHRHVIGSVDADADAALADADDGNGNILTD